MSGSESEEDLVEYGTPLEPLEEDEIPRKKPLTLEEQVATDEHGRRRFHGAFTGGFSAGFLNTVGSLEGWRPTAFKSSRTEKAITAGQKPEDFMDDEDMGEFGIAPNLLRATQDYSSSNKRKHVDFSKGPIPGVPVLKSLIQPVRETVGIKLLKRMGWKPGQGTGPRVSKRDKRRAAKTAKKIYGCMLPPGADDSINQAESESDSDSDLDWDNITFAPDDYEPFLCTPKENVFGIGYVGLDRRPILSASCSSELRFQEKNRKVHIKGQAFGVGAFEEEDEDIYSREDMSRYDFELNDEKKEQAKQEKYYKGVIEGFVAAVNKPVKKHFPPPVLPKNFKPYHKVRVSRFEPVAEPVERKDLKRHEMRAKDRQNLLGETSNEVILTETQKEARKLTEELVSNVKIDTSRFKPFAMDPDKQSRYEKYLKLLEVGKKDCLNDLQPITMTEWDKEREKMEFDQAARLFKPLTGVIRDRFTSASMPDDLSDPLAVVEKLKHGNEDQQKAAELKMYGKLTREHHEWEPSSLLCKRFNVPEPNKRPSVTPARKKPTFHIFDCLQDTSSSYSKSESEPELKSEPEPMKLQEKLEDEIPAISARTQEIVFEEPKEKIDLFKAIFLDSDDEEENKSEKEEADKLDEISTRNLYEDERITNEKRNTSPPRGCFENIDLDSLVAPSIEFKKKEVASNVVDVEKKKVEEEPVNNEDEAMAYMPKLPDKSFSTSRNVSSVPVISDNSEKWIEKKDHEKKHKKKDKKHKKDKDKEKDKEKDKHKSKHKHKKHKK